jgi:hypothetical protein
MKKVFQISLILWFASTATAQESPARAWEKSLRTLRVYDWKDLKVQQELPADGLITTEETSALEISNTNPYTGLNPLHPLFISLLKITNSSVLEKTDFVSCEAKYEGVAPGGLTLIYHLPPLSPGGDESTNRSGFTIDGNWKLYRFPLGRNVDGGFSTQVELKLSLPASGTVYIRPINFLGIAGSWWSVKQSGMVGGAVGIFGGIVGCFGGLVGCLAGFGKARKFVLTTTKIFIALGMLLTIMGIVAIACGQPFFVWYIFLLPGVMLTLIFSLNFPLIQRRYDDLEIRRMASIDAMGS